MSIWVVVTIGVGLLAVLGSVKVVPENERLAVVRAGQVIGVRGPGIVTLVPVLEKGVRVVLDRDITGWRSLPAERLVEQVRLHVKV